MSIKLCFSGKCVCIFCPFSIFFCCCYLFYLLGKIYVLQTMQIFFFQFIVCPFNLLLLVFTIEKF